MQQFEYRCLKFRIVDEQLQVAGDAVWVTIHKMPSNKSGVGRAKAWLKRNWHLLLPEDSCA